MQEGPVYCSACGLRVDAPGRTCPKCGEPLPAPPTVIGYGDPSKPPQSQPQQASSSVFGTSPLAMTPFPSARPPAPDPAPAPIPQDLPHHPPTAQVAAAVPLPPALAQLPPQPEPVHKPGTEQQAPAPAALQQSGVAPTVPDGEPMPQPQTRLRNKLAGVLLSIWGLLLLLVGLVFSGIHLTMIVQHGFWNLHDAVLAAFWISVALVPSALLQLAAGVANLTGRLAPRAQALVALAVQIAWGVAAVVTMNEEFLAQGPVLLLQILAGLTFVPSFAGAILTWAAARNRPMVYAPRP